jgi:NADP-dependent 3-hydroxy acid dehydrogenase YdfG
MDSVVMNKLNDTSQNRQRPASVVVMGVGAEQGIGAAVCRRFAQEKLTVYVVGRSLNKVQVVADSINAQGGQAIAYALDAENEQQVHTFFSNIAVQKQPISAVIHNVGGNIPSIFLKTSLQFFTQMWRSTFLSAFLVSQQALKIFEQQHFGTLIFTGASASLRGKPFFAAFTMGKSALRDYALHLAQRYQAKNIHVAHIIVDGMVDGDRVNKALWGLGGLLRKTRGTGGLNIEAIAENYWMLYQQHRDVWTHELDLRPHQEKF